MKILVLGAGALGGYFGARLIEAGADVTFLLRERRIKQLQETTGLQVKSSYGDLSIPDVKYITTAQIQQPYDLIILSSKAYNLEDSMEAIAPAVGPNTMILPVLNGMKHIAALTQKFGKQHILGGVAKISATLDEKGQILHLNKNHHIIYGELTEERTPRIEKIEALFTKSKFDAIYKDHIMLELWNKWIMISTAVGATCLFRGAISDLIKAGGTHYIEALLDEVVKITSLAGYKLSEENYQQIKQNMTSPENHLITSMLYDVEKGNPIESDAIIEDLLRLIPEEERQNLAPMLTLVSTQLKTYEIRRAREA